MPFPNSILIPSQDSHFVWKKSLPSSQGHDTLTQARIHLLAQEILRNENNFDVLRAPCLVSANDWRPRLLDVPLQDFYAMEKIDTSHPIWLGDRDSAAHIPFDILEKLNNELLRFFVMMYSHGFVAWGFELYLQTDGSVILLDFDKFGFRRPNWRYQVEYPVPWIDPSETFRYLAYPPDFAHRLQDLYHIRLENLQE